MLRLKSINNNRRPLSKVISLLTNLRLSLSLLLRLLPSPPPFSFLITAPHHRSYRKPNCPFQETRGPDCSLNNLDPELTLKRPVKRQLSNSPNGQEFLHLNRQISQLEEENLLLKVETNWNKIFILIYDRGIGNLGTPVGLL